MGLIAVGGFMHETNTFNSKLTGISAFLTPPDRPGFCTGPAVLEGPGKFVTSLNGFLEGTTEKHDTFPLAWASALAAGMVTTEAFETICDAIIRPLKSAQNLSGVYLELHGAMVSDAIQDGEGALLARVRETVGEAVPIVASLDYHANISPRMVEMADGFAIYRTYPHTDQIETGRRAAKIMETLISKGRPDARSLRHAPFLLAMNYQSTLYDPTQSIVAHSVTHQGDAVFAVGYAAGFPSADVYDCGPSVVAFGYSSKAVQQATDALYAELVVAEPAFAVPMYDAATAVSRAVDCLDTSEGPVLIADTQDNPGCGATGNTTGMIHTLLAHNVGNSTVATLYDPVAAKAASEAGVGACIELSLGGHLDLTGDLPLQGAFEVLSVCKDPFPLQGPLGGGRLLDMSPLVCLGYRGLKIVVSGKRAQTHDTAVLCAVGIDPKAEQIIVVKSSFHYRADFDRISTGNIVALAPGAFQADPAANNYEYLRPDVRRTLKRTPCVDFDTTPQTTTEPKIQ